MGILRGRFLRRSNAIWGNYRKMLGELWSVEIQASQYIGKGIYNFDTNTRIDYNIYTNSKILWGYDTHFGNIAAVRYLPYPWHGDWVCFIGTHRPTLSDIAGGEVPEVWSGMLSCVQKGRLQDPTFFWYWDEKEPVAGCVWTKSEAEDGHAPVYDPAIQECAVATDLYFSPSSIEYFNGYYRMIYRPFYWDDEDLYEEYNGTEYRTVKIRKTQDLFEWPIEEKEVQPLVNMPRYDGGLIRQYYSPKWYPPSATGELTSMYFNLSFWLGKEQESRVEFAYDIVHYFYHVYE